MNLLKGGVKKWFIESKIHCMNLSRVLRMFCMEISLCQKIYLVYYIHYRFLPRTHAFQLISTQLQLCMTSHPSEQAAVYTVYKYLCVEYYWWLYVSVNKLLNGADNTSKFSQGIMYSRYKISIFDFHLTFK